MDTIEKKIRHAMYKSAHFKEYAITERDREILQFIEANKGCYTDDLSAAFDIKTSNSHNSLRRLFDKQWLTRKRVNAEGGGIGYFYTLIKY